AVHLSAPAVQRRIQRMGREGIISACVAQIQPEAVGLPLTIIVEVQLVSETIDEIDQMKSRFSSAPEVQQCYYVTGDADFVLVLVVSSMTEYENFTRQHFFHNGNVKKFRTIVSMDVVKRGVTLNI
ncbi:Lrp/AsnC family transcriptional regulator, partial [Mesorhizobium sp. M7A.F.Ca.ET.027.03.2.1]